MKIFYRLLPLLFALLLPLSASAAAPNKAPAARKSTFIIAPFNISGAANLAHLERSIPQMLTSRLYWKDRVEPAAPDAGAGAKPIGDQAEAERLRNRFKADYVLWGTVNVMGETCSLDVRMLGKDGKVWAQARETRPQQVISAVSAISDDINREVFGRAAGGRQASGSGRQGRANQMNPDILVNETTNKEVYLNPQFRYSGSSTQDDSRLRSAPLNYPAIGMEVVDADGDGKNEIFLLEDTHLRAYSFVGGKLTPKGEFTFPANNQSLSVKSLPHGSGNAWLIVNTVDSGGVPNAFVLTWGGGQFTQVMGKIRWYLNVVKLPPLFKPVIIGQRAKPPRLFELGVHEMIREGNTLVGGGQINLPVEANVFSFTWMPADRGEIGGERLVVLTKDENLRVYNSKLNRLAATSEKYSGASVGMEIDPAMPGLQRTEAQIPSVFYIPIRMLAVDFERDGVSKLIVNKPISTAAQIFERYRSFPEGEIHSLFWDGVGLSLQWKTRRIKGTVADFSVADANNDGIPDLVVCVNTHPGALGVSSRRAMVLIYPLDIGLTNPGTTPDKSDIYD
ncbi:MAG: VCBS repeat-containing protein [Desulfovibrio sp.]|jgi:hypothetical protein|nr:VCBS repeat-containing protein [Desulfovibrio sp.]